MESSMESLFMPRWEDLDDAKLQTQDRERLEGKLADAYKWLENDGLKAKSSGILLDSQVFHRFSIGCHRFFIGMTYEYPELTANLAGGPGRKARIWREAERAPGSHEHRPLGVPNFESLWVSNVCEFWGFLSKGIPLLRDLLNININIIYSTYICK